MLCTCAGRILSGEGQLGLSANAALARGREQRLAAVVVWYCCLLGCWAAALRKAWCCFQHSHCTPGSQPQLETTCISHNSMSLTFQREQRRIGRFVLFKQGDASHQGTRNLLAPTADISVEGCVGPARSCVCLARRSSTQHTDCGS